MNQHIDNAIGGYEDTHPVNAPRVKPALGHPDELAIDKFAAAMEQKMAKKRADGRGGWEDPEQCSVEFLNELLQGHMAKGDPVDIGNFCMMLWNRGAPISTIPAQPRTMGGEFEWKKSAKRMLERCNEKDDRIQQLEEEAATAIAEANAGRQAEAEANERIQQLKAALQWYANDKNYYENPDAIFRNTFVGEDRGAKARVALHTDNSCGIAVNELIAKQSDSQKDGGE